MSQTLVHQFSVTIPAGTLPSAPLVTPTQFSVNEVERIEWLFPNGCNGQVGIQIGARSVQIVPANPGAFITRSGDSAGFSMLDMPDSGDWSVIGYNTGLHPHTIQVSFIVHRKERLRQELPAWADTELSYTQPPYVVT